MENNPTLKKICYSCICINSAASIALLISGLIVASIHGKEDQTSIRLLISFAVIMGNMMFLSICCLIITVCYKAIKKKENLTIIV